MVGPWERVTPEAQGVCTTQRTTKSPLVRAWELGLWHPHCAQPRQTTSSPLSSPPTKPEPLVTQAPLPVGAVPNPTRELTRAVEVLSGYLSEVGVDVAKVRVKVFPVPDQGTGGNGQAAGSRTC